MDADRDQIRAIFAQALKLPQADRAAFLDQACSANAASRAEVESLLSAADEAAGFMATPDSPRGASETKLAGKSMLVPILEKAGAIIGRYKLLQQIGEGGFGVVFMAEQREPVQRKVALKVIKLGMDTRQVIARFEAERQALALMDHPNVARVFDGGATDSGRPYFVMEYVRGDPITDFADHHKLGVRDRLDLFTQVCHAVQHAHQKGVIHRDIKPRNVLVSMVDGRPHAKVIDFGIAKATGGRLTDKTLFTEHRQLIGTPEYMSPEQAEGSPDIDTRTDVYALGVLLYELLTGVTPFDARRLRSAAFAEMQRIIREEEPQAPSLRILKPPLVIQPAFQPRPDPEGDQGGSLKGGLGTPTSEPRPEGSGSESAPRPEGRGQSANVGQVSNLPEVGRVSNPPAERAGSARGRPDSPRSAPADPTSHLAALAAARQCEPAKLGTLIKGDLDWIVMKALDKDRARRYDTASNLAQDIQRHLAGEPVLAAPPSLGYRIRKFVRKHRAGVLSAALVAATLLLGVAATSLAMLQARAERDRARNAEAAERQLRDRVRLANAELIMRQLEPDAYNKAAPLPSIDDLREACTAREELLGLSARATLDARFAYAKQIARVNPGEGLSVFRELAKRAERSTDLPRVRLIDMLQVAASDLESELEFDDARKANAKIAALLESCERDNTFLSERPALKFLTSVQGWSWRIAPPFDSDVLKEESDALHSNQYRSGLAELHEAIRHYQGRTTAELPSIVAQELALSSIGWGRTVGREGFPSALERCQDLARRACLADRNSRTCAAAQALVEFRAGRFEESLAQCDRARRLGGDELLGSAVELAARSMALSKLGRSEDARAALAQLRKRLDARAYSEVGVLINGHSGMEVTYLAAEADTMIAKVDEQLSVGSPTAVQNAATRPAATQPASAPAPQPASGP